jgi:hypothetical protein
MSRLRSAAVVAALLVFPIPGTAAAQGNGRGLGHGNSARPPIQQPGSSPAVFAVRNFGVWLDDASIVPDGGAWTSFGFGYWRSLLGRQVNAPSLDAGFGLSRSTQAGVTFSYSRTSYIDGSAIQGLGDTYVVVKHQLVDPEVSKRRVGFAVIPIIEILNAPPLLADGTAGSRVQWALPISIEVRRDSLRVYGSGGYFSRGALFGSVAAEVSVTPKAAIIGAISETYSTHADPIGVIGPARQRVDATGAAYYILAPGVAAYGGVARTISRVDENAATLAVNGGLSFTFSGQRRTRPSPPRR